MKRAVIYYSLTGNTKQAAEGIAKALNADLFVISTRKKMPKNKMLCIMLGGTQATFGITPDVKGVPENIDDYDEIILGTPIWASKYAPATASLIKDKRITEKVTAVFTFSGGGDNDKCMEKLAPQLPKLKNSVALADRANKLAKTNDDRILDFVNRINENA